MQYQQLLNLKYPLSKKNQLIAISHLPQIASKADNHLKVVKEIDLNSTLSKVSNIVF